MASTKSRINQVGAQSNDVKEVNGFVHPGMTAKLELITPEIASAYLETMDQNRAVSPDVVEKYGRDMNNLRWMVTTQGIGFSYEGRLIDGQHRLWAVVKTGVSAYTWVMRGLHPDAMRAVDDNRKRTFSDDLKIEDREQYTRVAATSRLIVCLQRGYQKNLKLNTAAKIMLSRVELRAELARLDQEGDVNGSTRKTDTAGRHLRVPGSAFAAAHYLATDAYGPEFADSFVDALGTGAGLQNGDPTLALRHRFEAIRDDRPKMEAHVYAGCILRVMKMEVRGESLRLFRAGNVGSTPVRRLFAA